MSRRACPPARTVGYRADDADLWLLWAVSQYVLATRDFAFLGQREPYLGTTRSGTVLQHLELAFRHQPTPSASARMASSGCWAATLVSWISKVNGYGQSGG